MEHNAEMRPIRWARQAGRCVQAKQTVQISTGTPKRNCCLIVRQTKSRGLSSEPFLWLAYEERKHKQKSLCLRADNPSLSQLRQNSIQINQRSCMRHGENNTETKPMSPLIAPTQYPSDDSLCMGAAKPWVGSETSNNRSITGNACQEHFSQYAQQQNTIQLDRTAPVTKSQHIQQYTTAGACAAATRRNCAHFLGRDHQACLRTG